LLNSYQFDERHLETGSETQSHVKSEGDGVRRRTDYRPVETDWQVPLNEVSLEEGVLPLEGPAFVNQGRKSPSRGIYVERRSYSCPEAIVCFVPFIIPFLVPFLFLF